MSPIRGSILLAAEPIEGGGVRVSFSDKVALPSGTLATWTFEPHLVEEEIDVEYRVLMSDFMRKALGCAEHLYRQSPIEPGALHEPGESSQSVRSSELRRRKGTTDRVEGSQRSDSRRTSPSSL